MSIYGRIVTGEQVEAAVQRTLQRWMPYYLSETADQSGLPRCDEKGEPTLPSIRSWGITTEEDKWTEDQMPVCDVFSPGLAEKPVRRAQGVHDAKFSIGLLFFVSGIDRRGTSALVRRYTAAGRACLLQNPSLPLIDGEVEERFADGVDWLDEDYSSLDFDDSRTIAGGIVNFAVTVNEVVVGTAGPKVPPPSICEPAPAFPIVESTPLTTETR